jgi:Co/Zn/Cd efflux system component
MLGGVLLAITPSGTFSFKGVIYFSLLANLAAIVLGLWGLWEGVKHLVRPNPVRGLAWEYFSGGIGIIVTVLVGLLINWPTIEAALNRGS